MLVLVRHAHAGDKHAWPGPDLARPLSATGRREAAGLLAQLAAYPIRAIVSSPALRCQQTVQPLADQRGLPVGTDELLAVDADVEEVLARLPPVEAHEVVWCSHGELIGLLLARLRDRGAPISRHAVWPKGSAWLLEPADGAIRRATYRPPLRAAR
ncbi:MAG TPA: phosphoglycerate mutase family protein [Actinomycetes bacterium]|jgi:8-oxo-dGTP diphosphatase|nr:phosphoglycerate mutase family protein [Actinomycetes bacterium]